MKKIFALLLAVIMVLSLAACGGGADNGVTHNDGFGGGFGGGNRRRNPNAPRTGTDCEASVTISFEEAAKGCKKEVSYYKIENCPECGGRGTVMKTQRTMMGMVQTSSQCTRCNGRGKIIHTPCPTCRGNGRVRKQKKVAVNIPAGIDNGQTISLRGLGNEGINGGQPGDLLEYEENEEVVVRS